MNKFLSLALLLITVVTANAQDKKAKDLLDQVTAKVKTYQNISIDFKYTLTYIVTGKQIGRAHV